MREKISMKRSEWFRLYDDLGKVNHLPGRKFAYAVAYLRSGIQKEIDHVNESMKPTEDYMKFESEKIKLCEKYALKDDKGKPQVVRLPNGSFYYKGLEDNKEFIAEIDKLKESHKDAVEKRENDMKEYQSMLNESVEIEVHKVKMEDVPNEITGKDMEPIMVIIDNTEVSNE